MRLAITHRFRFGSDRALVGDELAGADQWDALRIRTRGPFALPETRAALWARADEDGVARLRAEALDALTGDRKLASYGAGTGITELWLNRLRPMRQLVVAEFAPETVKRLTSLLPEVEVCEHDLRTDGPLDADLHLFLRIDTEFGDEAFRGVLYRFADVSLLVVATELLSARAFARELAARIRPNTTRAGLVRSRDAFEALWAPTHAARRVRVADLHGWMLEPRGTGRN